MQRLTTYQTCHLFYFHQLPIQHRKDKVSEMIETKVEISKDLEKALQALEQAKQRIANKA